MSVEVTRKKISSRNTMSVIEDIGIEASTLVFLFSAMAYASSPGSLRTISMNCVVELSIS